MPLVKELSTVEWHRAQVMPTLVKLPRVLTRPMTPTRIQPKQFHRDGGILQVHLIGLKRSHERRWQRFEIDFQSDRQGSSRIDRGKRLVHPQDLRPELLVAERIETKDLLTFVNLLRRECLRRC